MVDTLGKLEHSKPPVSLGMYKSLYKKDYQWCEEYKLLSDMQKLQVADAQLKAKEFAVPQEKPVIPYSNSVVRQRREVIPAPSIETISHADGMLLPRQKLVPAWATYQQFILDTSRESQNNGLQIKLQNVGSVLAEDCSDHDWRTTYNIDFKRRPGAYGGHCKGNMNVSHIFPKDVLHKNHWISEYNDVYRIFLWKLRWSSEIPAAGLCSGKGIEMDTAQ